MSVGLIPALMLLLWLLGLIGNAVWAVSTVVGGVAALAHGDRKGGRERLVVGSFLVGMFAVSGLIFLVLIDRWVTF